jgi:hypothetical protein
MPIRIVNGKKEHVTMPPNEMVALLKLFRVVIYLLAVPVSASSTHASRLG